MNKLKLFWLIPIAMFVTLVVAGFAYVWFGVELLSQDRVVTAVVSLWVSGMIAALINNIP